MLKKPTIITLLLILLFTFVKNAYASVEGDLGNFFTGLGYDGNITPGSVYQGQAAGYYSGGGAFLRNQVKHLQIINIDPPSYRAGCGGIDLFVGGFSFVNAQQITEFFQSVMNNAVGYVFTLALETVVPEISHVMEYIQKVAQEINANNFNSCDMAEGLVGGLWPRTEAAHRHICKDRGNSKGVFHDWAEARHKCGEETKYNEMIDAASKDAQYKNRIVANKNLIWDALLESKFLSAQKEPTKDKSFIEKLSGVSMSGDTKLMEFFMSLSGTIIYDMAGKAKIYSPLAKNREVIKALLEGGKANIYVCKETKKCLDIDLTEITISPANALHEKVKITINRIVEALLNETSDVQGLPNDLKGFLELTKFPILKFITVHLMSGNAAMAMSINNYSEAIAKSLLMQYLHEALQIVEHSLSGTDYTPEIHKQLTDQIHQALVYVEGIKVESRHEIQELMTFIDSSQKTEREVTSKVTGQIKHNFGVRP